MLIISGLAAILAAQASTLSQTEMATGPEHRDAGYEQLVGSDKLAAIAYLEELRRSSPQDPALLINLAAAYIEVGRLEDARNAYQLAIKCRDRQELELADGSWVDSRKLARVSLDKLEKSRAWAMK